jgi:hypothetical protein
MARKTASLFFKEEGYFVGSIQFDLILSENHALESQVTEHPIENGATVADHIRELPRKGSLSGLVTNFPLKTTASLPTAFMEKVAALGNQNYLESFAAQYGYRRSLGPTQADYDALERPANRAFDAWTAFKALMAARTPVVISTGLEKYYDAVITKVETSRESGTGDALTFRVEFQQIKIVTLTEVEITTTTKPLNLATATNRQASPKASKGKTGGTEKPITSFNSRRNTALGVSTLELSQ